MEWSRCRLGDSDVATVIMGQSPDSATYNSTGTGRPFFQGKADFGIRYPTARTWCSAPTRVAESGDILLSVRAPVGDVNIAQEKCCIGRGLAAIRPGPGVVGGFLFYLLLYRKPELDALGSGAIFRAVNRDTLHDFQFELPPLEEQRRIAVVLAKIQDAIEVQERFVATLKELKAATMAKIFREGLRGEPLKQTEIGEIPESWEVVPLGDVCQIERGKFTHRPRNEPRFYGGEIPFIQTGDVAKSNGRIRTYSQTLNEAGLAISRLFPRGTIVLTIAANIADTGILEFDSAFPDSLVGITPDHSIHSVFLEYHLRTQKREMNRLAPKGTQMNINIQFLRPWLVPRPSMQEQREIAGNLRCLDQVLDSALAKLEALRRVFFTVLHDLMTGRLRVSTEDSVMVGVERFMSELVRRLEPDRVTLFGPHVPGSPRAFGDVGLLVEMPFRGLVRDQAARIAREIPHDFSLDLLVRRPEELRRAREIGDRYLGGILERGRVLYARPPGAPARHPARTASEVLRRPPPVLSEEMLKAVVRRIVEAAAPEQIVLFGSAARGEMGPDSDVDLLVIKSCKNRREVAQTIRRQLVGVAPGLPKDIVVVTPEDVERDRDTIGYIIRPALREGRVVYAA
jgi:type I restriction enzyme S subunit